jgi:hypothetical protein
MTRGHKHTACPLCRHTLAPGLTPLVARALASTSAPRTAAASVTAAGASAAGSAASPESDADDTRAAIDHEQLRGVQLAIDAVMAGAGEELDF